MTDHPLKDIIIESQARPYHQHHTTAYKSSGTGICNYTSGDPNITCDTKKIQDPEPHWIDSIRHYYRAQRV
jgi:hypothetical protein